MFVQKKNVFGDIFSSAENSEDDASEGDVLQVFQLGVIQMTILADFRLFFHICISFDFILIYNVQLITVFCCILFSLINEVNILINT